MDIYNRLNQIHNALLAKFHQTQDFRYLGAANKVVEAINFVADAENIISDKDFDSIIPSIIRTVDASELVEESNLFNMIKKVEDNINGKEL